MKQVKGFYFPDYDTQCSGAVFNELYKIDKVLLYCSNLDTVVQAGGNVGTFPVELAKHFLSVYTFEPDAENYNCLSKNVENISNIFIHECALSDKKTYGAMFQPDRADNCGSLAIAEDVGTIPIITLDSLEIVDEVNLIYLDVEGAEYRALLGAKSTILRDKPVIVTENKGLIPEFKNTGLDGSKDFREWLCDEFNYNYVARFMRDDVFISA
jgi:FkbM family methyltransferase